MALTQNKTVVLSAESKVGEVVVARLTATVNSVTDVNSAYSEQVLDTKLYNDNKVEVRKDMSDFRALIYALEDELESENVVVAE